MQAAIVAAIAALAGVALSRILDTWTETTKWLREHRSVSYAAYLGAVERYLSGVLVTQGDRNFRTSAQGMELDRIHGDLQVFGSERAGRAADEVRDKLLAIHAIGAKHGGPGTLEHEFLATVGPAVHECRTAIVALRSIMKRELRVK